MYTRGSTVLVGAGVLWVASCTAMSGIDGYVFDLGGGGAGAAAGSGGGVTSGGAGGEAGWTATGGTAGSGGNGGAGGVGGGTGCQPGDTQTGGICGDCGTLTSTCTGDGIWGAESCEGEGPCPQGTTQQSNCDPCSQKTCQNDCNWSGCELKSGNECDYDGGVTWQFCGGDEAHWQYCLIQCVWASCQPIP